MGISPYPASVLLPKVPQPYPSILEFLCRKFPRVDAACWARRIAEEKVLLADGSPVSAATAYQPDTRILYFREVEQEEVIPFREKLLYQDDDILVCCKPHFLPVTPGGRFVEQSLLYRLRKATGRHDLVPLHRIDRETAGLVLFSVNPKTRTRYYELFKVGAMHKSYEALAACPEPRESCEWLVENRLAPGEPWFRMQTVPGVVNARSRVELLEAGDGLARFRLTPFTGKTHQLRVHLSGLGFPILHDRLYPTLQEKRDDDFSRPLQLLAKSLRFTDPVSGKAREFESDRQLLW